MKAKAKQNNHEDYSGIVQTDSEGGNSVSLLIKGVHCALCIQKIETAVLKNDNVKSARLNFSTGRLNVVWDGRVGQVNQFTNDIEKQGYQIFPYDPAVEKDSHDKDMKFLLICIGIAGFAMGNIMLLSVGLWTTDSNVMGGVTRNFLHWVSALIAMPAILYSGQPFFRSAWAVLRSGHTNMDVPISLALLLAMGMSLFETITHGEHVYFDSAVMLMFFLLVGRYFDLKARKSAKGAATELMESMTGFATVLDGKKVKRILIRDVKEGMVVLVAAGEKVPVDGIIQKGKSSVDNSLITGETLPRDIKKDDLVYAGTINLSAPLEVNVQKEAEDSLLSDIVRLMEKAEQAQAHYVRLADKAARLYTPVVHLLSLTAFILWWGFLGADWQDALLISVTVLIITCPCALGLAVPVVQVLATGILMKQGVFLKSGDALERLSKVDVAIFDKTGTLTFGAPVLVSKHRKADLKLAASLAAQSVHPLCQSLVKSYEGSLHQIDQFKEFAGKGVEAVWNKKNIRLGSLTWCGISKKEVLDQMAICLLVDGKEQSIFIFEDQLRKDVKSVIKTLENQGIEIILLSGDREIVAKKIANEANIQTVFADQTPADKVKVMEQYKNKGHHVLMVGDGLNDAPVLSNAYASMAPGNAVDMAQNAADIVFMGGGLSPVSKTYQVAKQTQWLVKQNFALAIGYNCMAVPLAFMGMVTPMVAALAMSGSSLLVILNAYRLRWKT